jgi:hypothetical protein
VWKCYFKDESGIDQGGLFRDCITTVRERRRGGEPLGSYVDMYYSVSMRYIYLVH